MKKEDAVESIAQAGYTINDVNQRIWNIALNPTQHGWASSIASVAAIPVLSAASLGQLVSEAVVRQVPTSVFDRLPNLTQPDRDRGTKNE